MRFIVIPLAACLAACQPAPSGNEAPADEGADAQRPPVFVDMTVAAGLDFTHDNGASAEYFMPEIMGSGVALFDADSDGDLDVYLVQGADLQGDDSPPSDRLFRNDLDTAREGGSTLSFTDVTNQAGISPGGVGMGVASGDYDGDGNVDLYITNFGGNRLWRNLGDGRFEDVTAMTGTSDSSWSVPAAFFDIENDGDLDLYVGSYLDFRLANHKDCFFATGIADYCGPHSYGAVPDKLFRNDGNGGFEDASAASGLRRVPSKALGAVPADFDGDGFLDLYVANDGVANQLWMNNGDGTFDDTALMSGSALNFEGSAEASMGVDAADIDGDGDEDMFMTHLRGETNTLYLNRGDASFEDSTIRFGLAASSLPLTGFGTAWVDVDNDGGLDLVAVNGAVYIEERLLQAGDKFPYHQRNQLFMNVSDDSGLRFEEVQLGSDDPLTQSDVSRGAAFGDIDNDGDIDVVINNNGGPAQLLVNELGQHNAWLGLRLLTTPSGADAIGATATITTTAGMAMTRRVRTAGSYASANDPRLLFGLGDATDSLEVIVRWPGGVKEIFGPLAPGSYHALVKGEGRQ